MVSLALRANSAVGIFPSTPTVADGSSYSFTGPASSTNLASKNFLGGLNGPIDAGTLDSDFSNASWSLVGNYMPRWDNDYTLCRSKSLGFNEAYHVVANPGNSASFGMALDLGTGLTEVMLQSYIYFGCNPSANLLNLQWKLFRLMPTGSVVDTSPMLYAAHWKANNGAGDFVYPAVDGVYWLVDHSANFPAFNTGHWYRLVFWCRPATGSGAANGAWSLTMYDLTTGSAVLNIADTGVNDYNSSTIYRYLVLQNYFGNADPEANPVSSANNTTTFTTGGGGYAYWDDITVQWGTGCRRQILLGDASTWAACNPGLLAYQPWTVWSGLSRTITINKGPHSNLTSKYLYELDDTGTVINTTGIPLA